MEDAHGDEILQAAFSPNGNLISTGSKDGLLKVIFLNFILMMHIIYYVKK